MAQAITTPTARPLLVSVTEARHILGDIGKDAIYDLARSHRIASTKQGTRRMFFYDDLERYVAELRAEAVTR